MRKLLCLFIGLLPLELAVAGPLRLDPTFTGVHITEVTSGNLPFFFSAASTELTTQVNLGSTFDFTGAPTERYDVFYSNSAGAFDLDGEYITIQGTYSGSGAGFNIASVVFEFTGLGLVSADLLTAFNPGIGYVSGSEANAVDANANTFTSLGQGTDANAPMSITVGLSQSTVPEPSTFGLAGAALAGVLWRMRRRG